MYFAGHRSGYIGLLRALSVVVGEHVPHIVIKDPKPPSRPGSQARSVSTYGAVPFITVSFTRNDV